MISSLMNPGQEGNRAAHSRKMAFVAGNNGMLITTALAVVGSKILMQTLHNKQISSSLRPLPLRFRTSIIIIITIKPGNRQRHVRGDNIPVIIEMLQPIASQHSQHSQPTREEEICAILTGLSSSNEERE